MRILRYLLLIALACGLSGVANADDFQMVVVDPYTGPYTIFPILSTSATFTFSECEEPGQLPAGANYDECFSGQNETGITLTSLDIRIPLIAGQTAGCDPSTFGLDIFSSRTCTTTSNGYVLDFSGGNIPTSGPGSLFTVAELGVSSGFPDAAATFNATPEPSSIWLLFTGVLSIGFFFARRQRGLRALRP